MGYEQVKKLADSIRTFCGEIPDCAVVLGSGLGAFCDALTDAHSIPYAALDGFPVPTVAGHRGELLCGTVGGRSVLVFAGRLHLYEGHSPETVTLYVRALALLGVKTLILTNAAGAINTAFYPGDLMLISDHIGLFCPSPLWGENEERFGVRFPSMSAVYDPALRAVAKDAARACRLSLREGIYAYTQGPMYETPAEVRALRTLGADACGMSTVAEATVACHAGLRVLGISCLTNMAAGILDQPLDHSEVIQTGAEASARFVLLLRETVARL